MDTLSGIHRRERIIAAVRWAAVLLLLGHVAFFAPADDEVAAVADAAAGSAVLLAGLLVVAGVVAEVSLRTALTARTLRRVGAALLAADVVAGVGIVFIYPMDAPASPWIVLTVLPLEGALRFGLPGALGTWAVIAPLYVVRDATVAVEAFSAWRVANRLTLLLVIALFAGGMARELHLQRRLLGGVADASRQLVGRVDPDEVHRVLCREVVRCIDARFAVVYGHDDGVLRPLASFPEEDLDALGGPPLPDPSEEGSPTPVWVEGDGRRAGRLLVWLRGADGAGAHVLVITTRGARRPSRFVTEAAAALAESASVALAAARVLAAEHETNLRLRYLEALRIRFVATIAHDLRLPLTVFTGVAKLLRSRREAIEPAQIDELLVSVERQAARLTRLAEDLLDAARLDVDRLELHLEPCDVRGIVESVTADLDTAVDTTFDDDVTVVADRARLERIIWNLLSNAQKYGRPPVELHARRDVDHVVVEVRDHGPGLDEAQREQLFSDFAGSDDPASVGLGLAIVWQLVDAHGGRTSYRDAEPGAAFRIELPVAGPPPAEPP